jgi:hypothetical protein
MAEVERMTTTIAAEPVRYGVSWGIEEHERQTYTDNGDGSFLSVDAEARANRAWFDLIKQGVRVGFFVDGVHKAGDDFAEKWAAAEAAQVAVPVKHKTRTFLYSHETHLNWRKVQTVGDPFAWAACDCGWKVLRDNRGLARRAAHEHRESASRTTTEGA